MSQADDVAAAPGGRDERAGALHARPIDLAGIDGVAERAVDERAERADVSDRCEPGLDRLPCVAHAEQRVLCRGCRRARHAGRLDLADEVTVRVDEAGQDGEPGEVDDPRAVGRPFAHSRNRLDARVAHEERSIGQVLAGLHVEQPPDMDGDRTR